MKLKKRASQVLIKEYNALHLEITELQDFIHQHLETHPCMDCGQNDPAVLEFDHVRGDKLFNVSNFMYNQADRWTVEREIEKCDVRCRTCHCKRHGYKRHAYLLPACIDRYLLKQFKKRGYDLAKLVYPPKLRLKQPAALIEDS